MRGTIRRMTSDGFQTTETWVFRQILMNFVNSFMKSFISLSYSACRALVGQVKMLSWWIWWISVLTILELRIEIQLHKNVKLLPFHDFLFGLNHEFPWSTGYSSHTNQFRARLRFSENLAFNFTWELDTFRTFAQFRLGSAASLVMLRWYPQVSLDGVVSFSLCTWAPWSVVTFWWWIRLQWFFLSWAGLAFIMPSSMTYLSSLTVEVPGTRFYKCVKLRLRISNVMIRSWRTGRLIYAAHSSLRFDVVT